MRTATSEILTWCVYWVVLHGRARAALFLSPFLSLSISLLFLYLSFLCARQRHGPPCVARARNNNINYNPLGRSPASWCVMLARCEDDGPRRAREVHPAVLVAAGSGPTKGLCVYSVLARVSMYVCVCVCG